MRRHRRACVRTRQAAPEHLLVGRGEVVKRAARPLTLGDAPIRREPQDLTRT